MSSLIERIKESCSRLEEEVEGVVSGCVHFGGISMESLGDTILELKDLSKDMPEACLIPQVEDKGETGEPAREAGN